RQHLSLGFTHCAVGERNIIKRVNAVGGYARGCRRYGAHGTHANQNHRPRYPFKPAARPRAANSLRASAQIPIDRHCRRRILPAVSSFEAFRTPASVRPLAPVPGRHPKTLNDSGRLNDPSESDYEGLRSAAADAIALATLKSRLAPAGRRVIEADLAPRCQ